MIAEHLNLGFLISSIFLGFGVFSLLKFILKSPKFLVDDSLDDSATLVVRFTGLIYLMDWVMKLLFGFLQPGESGPIDLSEMAIPFFIQPLLYFVFSQLLWVKKVRITPSIRILIGLVFLISISRLSEFLGFNVNHDSSLPEISYAPKSILFSLVLFGIVLSLVTMSKNRINNPPVRNE